jgi:hypothetical protein
VSVQIATNGQDFTHARLSYNYNADEVVQSLEPLEGPASGYTLITITGQNFVQNSALCCKFGSVQVTASWVSSNAITCLSPSHAVGFVAVEVANNGLQFSSNDVLFQFVANPVVFSLRPVHGPMLGGSLVVVRGQNFLNTTASALLNCAFGSVWVPAVFINSTYLECVTPPQSVGVFVVEVTENGLNFTRNGQTFTYYCVFL